MSDKLADNSSPLSLLTVLKSGGSSCFSADSKPPKSVDDMIQLMKTRELVVTDENNLKSMLYNCNYYRLSGYFRVFQIDPSSGNNQFKPGSKDVDFLVPYKMDEELRTIILKGTAQVELTLRSRFAYHVANSGGAYTYLNRIVLQKKSTKNIRNTLKECLKLKNGNVQEFVDHIYYGDELWFRYKGRLYFLEGWHNENHLDLKLYEMHENGKEYSWKGDNKKYPVDEFINAKIWNDKTFWQVEQDIEWVDDDAS